MTEPLDHRACLPVIVNTVNVEHHAIIGDILRSAVLACNLLGSQLLAAHVLTNYESAINIIGKTWLTFVPPHAVPDKFMSAADEA
jgi:hypothetical protein